jgi:hypothetical protein
MVPWPKSCVRISVSREGLSILQKKNHDSKSTSVYLVDQQYQWQKNDISEI